MNIKEKAKKLKSDMPIIFLVLKDKETPTLAKIVAGITALYALSPVDLIPDFIPILGYLDDIIILPLLILLTIKLIPKEVWEKNRKIAEEMPEEERKKKWYYSIPVLIIWGLIIFVIVRAIWLKK